MAFNGGWDAGQSTSQGGSRHTEPNILTAQEKILVKACKRALKSRFFRGYYVERRYVECLCAYRDIVALNSVEGELAKLLLIVNKQMQLYYRDKAPMWSGITHGKLADSAVRPGALLTCIWTELREVAFGQYWFSIKTVHMRHNELVIRLKIARPVLPEDIEQKRKWSITWSGHFDEMAPISTSTLSLSPESVAPQNRLRDFTAVLWHWGRALPWSVWDFARHHVTIANVIDAFRLIGLLTMLVMDNMVTSVKYLGAFTLYFMFELCRLSYVLRPVLLKGLELLNNIVVGFYALLIMIWKDLLAMKPAIKMEEFERKSQ